MPSYAGLQKPFQPDWQGLIDNILHKGTPDRVYNIELLHDEEAIDAIVDRFDLASDIDRNDPDYDRKRIIAFHRFCGFDYIRVGLDILLTYNLLTAEDTAGLKRADGREFQDEHSGPIMSWEDFEKYPWPDPNSPAATESLEWYQENLPEDMCIIGGYTAHFCESLTWLMGYETFCYALHDQPDLVKAIADRLKDFYSGCLKRYLEFDRVKLIWASDDMGFKTGLLFPPDDMRKLVLDNHKVTAKMAHSANFPYLLHVCGKIDEIRDDLIDDVKIDAKHSFEDTIEDIRDASRTYGQKIAVLGGIDVDFLCRNDETAIRKRVRDTIDVCQPGGGFCLGTGNSVTNYIPIDNYLTMIDEGRLYTS